MKEAQLYTSDEMLGFLRQPNLHELLQTKLAV